MSLSQPEQIKEATGRGTREQDGPESTPRDIVPEVTAETTTEEAAPVAAVRDAETPPPPPDRRRVDPRDAIVARFREGRETDESESDAAEIRRFANQGLPPEMVEPPEPELEVEPEPEPETVAPRRRVKVRGQEIELTDEELIAAAQKGLAGDSYFEEGRRTADEAKQALDRVNVLLRQTEQGLRTPAAEHPGDQTAEPEARGAPEHPEVDPFVDAVKQIAYEEPEKAGATLRALVENVVRAGTKPATQEVLRETRQSDELARSRAAMTASIGKHQDIAQDPMAIAAIQHQIAVDQLEDLKALGIEESALPKTRDEIGRWHLFYRAEGMKVTPMAQLFTDAIDRFQKWKGGTAEPPVADPTRRVGPRVEVSIDRTQRRANIPQQPTRAVAPRPDSRQPTPPQDRSAVVQRMMEQRAKTRGRVVA